ncbi:MAG: PEP-CTERM sorting domain-containing protein [Hassallia sp. WJT32-NPBG1]|jgi:hypothetical protein|nr:PEP-CTERM sorting domain-containing protein [Hassallia sp. WJT32-NPBG1]
MSISALIQGLSIATVLLVAQSPAYGARIFITTPEAQLDDDPVLDVAGRPGDTISWEGFFDTTGLTAPLQSITTYSTSSRASDGIPGEIIKFELKLADDDPLFFPNLEEPITFDSNTGLTTLTGFRSGPPGLPPNYIHKIVDVFATLGPELNNDGQIDYRIGVLSAIDVNGTDVTDQFERITQEFEFQPVAVPEPSTIFGLVLAGGFGGFLRKQKRKVQY